MWPIATERFAERDPAVVVAAFHTSFNVLGVLIFIGLTAYDKFVSDELNLDIQIEFARAN